MYASWIYKHIVLSRNATDKNLFQNLTHSCDYRAHLELVNIILTGADIFILGCKVNRIRIRQKTQNKKAIMDCAENCVIHYHIIVLLI